MTNTFTRGSVDDMGRSIGVLDNCRIEGPPAQFVVDVSKFERPMYQVIMCPCKCDNSSLSDPTSGKSKCSDEQGFHDYGRMSEIWKLFMSERIRFLKSE